MPTISQNPGSDGTMAAEEAKRQQFWDGVLELTEVAQERGTDPLIWVKRVFSSLSAAGVHMPSIELAELLVSHICWSNNTPVAWKFLERALTVCIVPPLLVLALLSNRVIPSRRRYPVAYKLYMELMRRYVFSLPSLVNGPNHQKIMESIDNVLQLRKIFGVQSTEPGHLLVEFIFSFVWELLDAALDDEGLLEHTIKKKSSWPIKSQDMEIDCPVGIEGKNRECQAALIKMNTIVAIEIIGDFFQNKVTSRILYLVCHNMPMHWNCFSQHLKLLTSRSASLRNSKNISPEALMQLASDTQRVLSHTCKMSIIATPMSSSGKYNGTVHSALWLPIDLYLEELIDGSQVRATSAAKILSELVKALQALNRTTWRDAFLGLWTAALRLVQRERKLMEGPDTRIDTGLSLLLSIVPLAIVNIIDEEEIMLNGEAEKSSINQRKRIESVGKCREHLVSSLILLGDFEKLLDPPSLIKPLANQAAVKALMFLSGVSIDSGYLNGMSLNDIPTTCCGNLRHLIVESCIARNVLDTSVYMWPGYVQIRRNQLPQNISGQVPGWSSLMSGSPLTPPMISALVSTPATSLAEIERIYEIAVTGTDDEKVVVATILSGASLIRGWSVQEHTCLLIIKLLSHAVPTDYSGIGSHLIGFAPYLNTLIVGILFVGCVQVFSMHGLVPQLAVALMPICEVFGSHAPNMSWTLNTGEEISSHAVFSNVFVLLLKLWKFDKLPMGHVNGDGPSGSNLTLYYLLSVHKSQLAFREDLTNNNTNNRLSKLLYTSQRGLVLMDCFPKLKRWYRKNQECIVATHSSLVPGETIHEVVEILLSIMFRKLRKGGQTFTPTTSGSSSSSSSASGPDESLPHLNFSAWDILEALPFVLDAALMASAHEIISPRELITGLRHIVDILPASLVTIFCYYSAEVSRGLWKHAFMNGVDWPSPGANLSVIEEQTKKILAAAGVKVPCPSLGSSSPVTLPLPLAVLVGVIITYKLNQVGQNYLHLIGPSMATLAVSCPPPCMSIISAIWAQKAKSWNDYLICFSAQSIFHHDDDAVAQLLRTCFAVGVGLNSSGPAHGGVGPFLGHDTFDSHFSDNIWDVAPGRFYFRVHRAIRSLRVLTKQVMSILMETVGDITTSCRPHGRSFSLSAAASQVKTAASLAASLIWITGGPDLVDNLIREILPCWFISSDRPGPGRTLGGQALAYFSVFCGLFAWGLDSLTEASRRRRKVLGMHFEFLEGALDGKISLGCDEAMWRAYVMGYLSLVISCAPRWVMELDVEAVKRVGKGVRRRWNEDEMGVALLCMSGVGAMGAAAEMIIETAV